MLIYGSNGYTGQLIVEEALAGGARPILAGRSAAAIEALAAKHGLDCAVFSLDDTGEMDAALSSATVVIHCAGPFSRTAQAMAEACIRTGTHYLDITGEIEVFEALAALGDEAKRAKVMLMPGAGFDVVPSDCLAAHLKSRLPSATELTLAFKATGKPSRGTATTMIENLPKGGLVRRDGVITKVPSAWKKMDIDYGEGPEPSITIPWGDVSTAFYSTGIPNIEVYMAAPASMRVVSAFSRYFGFALGSGFAQRLLKRQIQRQPPGPNPEERASAYSLLWGEARDGGGHSARSRLRAADGYTLTAKTAFAIAQRVLSGDAPSGFQTPSMAYGADYILEFEGSEREDC